MEAKESMFDDETIEMATEMEAVDLIVKLLSYTQTLEETIIGLRKEVNGLTPPHRPSPYFDLHSDLYEVFDEHPAYERYRDIIEKLIKY
ncbi:hypothetical protein [Ammoniphilus resinae]|uniref:Uncharacterized protein n=1 Tax=Ammoniphilus resinae TaxID=861532 RepID=A0ABS4GXY6_9BACL|nr:hypothetical protein [Ammoniphilus resinae]MBP1935124.1 hypothetical protein [Ammoniphilus resinae]